MNEPLLYEFKSITSLSEDEKADLAAFSCGVAEIDEYLHEDALDDAQCNITRTFLFYYSPKKELIGYFSLTADRAHVIKSSKLKGKLPKHAYFPKISDLFQLFKFIILQ
ncbi:hypothetical protein [Listeria costaricensis]|uniref:hypothetical protein n=1 Tax=Listeria costaricensis TaxID=2026604 RepID=UPI000C06A9B7|nr:hypothetical protein [Listeria costaricensis]